MLGGKHYLFKTHTIKCRMRYCMSIQSREAKFSTQQHMNDTTCMNEMQHGIYFAYSNKIQDLNILLLFLLLYCGQIRLASISMSLRRCIRQVAL